MTVGMVNLPGKEPALRLYFSGQSLAELRKVLDRAMNTWEPADQPVWLQDLSEVVDLELAQ